MARAPDALTRIAPELPPLLPPLLLPLLLLPDAVAAGVAVAMAPTPPVTGPLSWSYLRERERLISGLPSRRRYRS